MLQTMLMESRAPHTAEEAIGRLETTRHLVHSFKPASGFSPYTQDGDAASSRPVITNAN